MKHVQIFEEWSLDTSNPDRLIIKGPIACNAIMDSNSLLKLDRSYRAAAFGRWTSVEDIQGWMESDKSTILFTMINPEKLVYYNDDSSVIPGCWLFRAGSPNYGNGWVNQAGDKTKPFRTLKELAEEMGCSLEDLKMSMQKAIQKNEIGYKIEAFKSAMSK